MRANAKTVLFLVAVLALTGIALAIFSQTTSAPAPEPTREKATLVIGVLPDEQPKKIIEKTRPLEEYLEKRLGVDVKLYGTTDYASLIVAFESNKVDLAWFGGLSYLKAHERAGALPLVTAAQQGSPYWDTVFITYPGSGIETMEDLAAKAKAITFAFGDPASTSGSLMPTFYLKARWGIDREADFKKIIFTGAHDATALAVINRQVEAGALNGRIFNELVSRGIAKPGENVHVVWRTPQYADYVWAANPHTLQPELIEEIKKAFLDIRDREILEVQRAEKYVPVDDSLFEDLRKIAVELGFLREAER